jgi:Nucleotidyl transferase AbiEii toxin, Type IV TA system
MPAMDDLDEDILNLWRLLHKNQTKYIMVGGFACSLHGFNRMTEDIDIWIKDDAENRKRLRKALNELGLGDFESLETTDFVPGYTSIMLGSGFELDIMSYLTGLEQIEFDECYQISPTALIEEIPVKFLHINQLIEAKKATARPKDLIDVEELEKIRKMQSSKGR